MEATRGAGKRLLELRFRVPPTAGGSEQTTAFTITIHGQYFTEALLVHPDRSQERQVHNASAPVDLEVSGVQVQIRVGLLLPMLSPTSSASSKRPSQRLYRPTIGSVGGLLGDKPYAHLGHIP